MQISTRYRIQESDLESTLDAIKSIGFVAALDLAYNGSIGLIKEDKDSTLATRFLSWSYNLLLDSRKAKSHKGRASDLLLLSNFYRQLAHKVYWVQRKRGNIGLIKDFIQVID